MYKISFAICAFLACALYVKANGEFTIIQSPESILFSGQDEIDTSSIKNVLGTALGFSVPEGPRWPGMVVKDPFHFADAVITVSVPGVSSLDPSQGHTYSVHTDEPVSETFQALEWALLERYPAVANLTLMRISMDRPKDAVRHLGELNVRESTTTESLNVNNKNDKAFLDQVMLLDAVTSKLCAMMCNDDGKNKVVNDGIPDVYWFTFPGLRKLIEAYGPESKQVEDAKRLLTSSVLLLSEVFNTAYDYQVVFSVLSTDSVHHKRFTRQAPAAPGASDSDENFPAIFNIFLWFTFAFVLALLSISVGIAQLDPGRDSIIYRMTSNRMKKEN